MLASSLLLAVAIAGGTMLTFLFDHSAPRAARICMGACLGLALQASLGFLLALGLGLGAAAIGLSAGLLLLPLLLVLHGGYRARVMAQLQTPSPAAPPRKARRERGQTGYWIFYLAVAVLLGLIFNRAAYERPEGIFTGIVNNLGDLPLHLQVINSFAQGHNFPPQDPTYAGVRFAYPFLADFHAAMLVRAGAGVITALWLQNMVLGLALVGSLHYWTLLLTRNARAGVLAPLLVIFSGGLGWWLLFYGAPPFSHDYTIRPDVPNSILRWGNSLTTLFVPQRSILFGIPLALFIFSQWWLGLIATTPGLDAQAAAAGPGDSSLRQKAAVRTRKSQSPLPAPEPSAEARMMAAGLCAGLLPLIHAHSFLVVMAVGLCLAVLFHSSLKGWALFFGAALLLSLPEIYWLAHTGGVNAQSYLGWHLGWDHGDHNILWFWFVNAGPFLLALLAALLWRGPELALPRRLIRFYAPFAFCFLVPNLIKLAPWVWDNIKVLFLWYIASAPLVALLLARWWERKWRWRWLAPLVFASMVLAGGLDVLRAIAAGSEYQEFEPDGIAIAAAISRQAAPRARVLHAPTYNTPVFLTGRRSLLGYPGWLWSRGLDYRQRESDIQRIYSGGPEAGGLLRQYAVDYLLVGPQEHGSLRVDEAFLSQYKKLAEAGPYRLYQINHRTDEVRTEK
jgi:hypothetical protein